MTKIAVITEGGRRRGLGHVTRCLGLYSELEKKGLGPYFIVNDDPAVAAYLKGKRARFYKSGKSAASAIAELCAGADIAIVDSYDLNRPAYVKIGSVVRMLVSIDDNNRIDYPDGIVVNGSIYASRIGYARSRRKAYLLGPRYIPMRPEFIRFGSRRIRKDIKNILITFGGSDSRMITPKVRDFILDRFPGVRLDVIVGKAFRDIKKLKKSGSGRVRYHYDISAKEMLRLMLRSDAAVSAGGQTLYELARTGTPCAGVCVADNQVNNLKGWRDSGFLVYCGWYNSPGLLNRIGKAIIGMRDEETRRGMSAVGQRMVDGKGAKRLAEEISARHGTQY
ncbi:MAG: UDP-2,4-diacetamido-2,4,6-trideoxy-beta-L-altropyranose hydrolase [Candidatus Omnitrophota bacterium]